MRRSMTIPTLNSPPPGWFILDVMQAERKRTQWVALMIDVDPDVLKYCKAKVAFLYVHPKEYQPTRTLREAWVPIAGKYKTRDAAWDALEEMMQTRH